MANIGFVSTRFQGTDGVTLESAKWAEILWHHKHVSYWYAGKNDRAPDISMTVPEAHFDHPVIQELNQELFGKLRRSPQTTRKILDLAEMLKASLYDFLERFSIDILCVQNALCIPMNVPLGVALTQLIAETHFPTIAHHHDFYWERSRFSINAAGDYLAMAFPPNLPAIQHATINTAGQQLLSHRKGISSILVPNVLDFENAPEEPDEFLHDFREQVGIAPDELMILQPTRVVPRKGIEHAVELVSHLGDMPCVLVITHAAGDEGYDYRDAVAEMAAQRNVDMRFIDGRIGEHRGYDEEGRKIFSLWDAYQEADLITYPSSYEGFGNALLEAFYVRKPVVVNRYSIFIEDIEPKGFRVITMNGYVTRSVVQQVRQVLKDAAYRKEMVEHNFEIARSFYSYSVLKRKLRALVTHFTGLDHL